MNSRVDIFSLRLFQVVCLDRRIDDRAYSPTYLAYLEQRDFAVPVDWVHIDPSGLACVAKLVSKMLSAKEVIQSAWTTCFVFLFTPALYVLNTEKSSCQSEWLICEWLTLCEFLPWLPASFDVDITHAAFSRGFTLLHAFDFEATRRSCPLCNPIQNWVEFPKYRLSRKAVSAVIPRFPRTRSFTRGMEIYSSFASL
jgi:hypothetical protein